MIEKLMHDEMSIYSLVISWAHVAAASTGRDGKGNSTIPSLPTDLATYLSARIPAYPPTRLPAQIASYSGMYPSVYLSIYLFIYNYLT